jgi:isoleucyl-tRNA synthetase
MSSVVMKADNLSFSESSVDDIRKNVMNIWWNVFAFYKIVVPVSTDVLHLTSSISHPLDKWLLSKIEGLTQTVTNYMDSYDVVSASRPLMAFAKEFSTWYLRLSRERLRDHAESQAVFAYALTRYTLLMAPFAPFMSERIYQNMPHKMDSVHLENWPAVRSEFISPELEKSMETVMQIVEKGHAARKDAGIRLRQPLTSVTILADLSADLLQLVADELNVKKVIVGKEFALELNLTEELKAEGTARDLMRDIQGMRKKQGLNPSDNIAVELPSWPETWMEEIKKKVGATTITRGETPKVTKL